MQAPFGNWPGVCWSCCLSFGMLVGVMCRYIMNVVHVLQLPCCSTDRGLYCANCGRKVCRCWLVPVTVKTLVGVSGMCSGSGLCVRVMLCRLC